MAHPSDMTHYLGIDPGISGGLAVVDQMGDLIIVGKMPSTIADIIAWLANTRRSGARVVAVIERVHSLPIQGHVGAMTFGINIGTLHTALTCTAIPFDLVTPQTWQRAMGCLTKGDKNISKRRAQALFPRFPNITHAIADALLIAEYCRRIKGPLYESQGQEEGRQSQDRQPRQDRTRQTESGWQDERAPQNRLASVKVARPPTRASRH